MDQIFLTALPGFPCQVVDDATPEGAAQIVRYVAFGGSIAPATPELLSVFEKLGRGIAVGAGAATATVLSSALAAAKAAAGGGGNAILWAPDGSGDATTWADVMRFIDKTPSPVTVYTRPGTKEIPAGTYELNHAAIQQDTPVADYGTINVLDGALLRNLGSLGNSQRVESVSSAPCLEFDLPSGGAPRILFLTPFGGGLQVAGASPMIVVPAGELFVIACLNGGGLNTSSPGVSPIQLGTGSGLLVVTQGFPPNFGGDFVRGDATTLLGYGHFGIGGPYPAPGSFAGTVLNAPLLTMGGSGPTATRPTGLFGPLSLGTTYFDTDLVPPRPIWWDGTQWVDATGTGPV